MSCKRSFISALFLAIISIISFAHTTPAAQDPITVDTNENSTERSFYVVINPTLPVYHFRFIANPKDRYIGVSQNVGRVEITGPDNIEQAIEVFAYASSDAFMNHYYVGDINFDGYIDLGVIEAVSSKFATYTFLIFDPRSGQFINNHLTNELSQVAISDISLNHDSQEIQVDSLDVCCPTRDIYKIIDNHLVRIATIESEITRTVENNFTVDVKFRELQNGQLVTVSQWQTIDSELEEDHMFSFESFKERYSSAFVK